MATTLSQAADVTRELLADALARPHATVGPCWCGARGAGVPLAEPEQLGPFLVEQQPGLSRLYVAAEVPA